MSNFDPISSKIIQVMGAKGIRATRVALKVPNLPNSSERLFLDGLTEETACDITFTSFLLSELRTF